MGMGDLDVPDTTSQLPRDVASESIELLGHDARLLGIDGLCGAEQGSKGA